ncbi:hypothetical protein BDP27DRAFT_1327319 [Rhodocollybia butyracea]|uniref:DUF6533 domain-containing protein n=1 Tax=Rhodocollybia butyracea TaxID=206335 RepID=A0A9P5PMB6_9AGAR|nr:hypothetical protein BDP27DRAFT_1327319 [Rhodocollybia butyracea]
MHIRLGAAVLGLVTTGCDIALTMRGEVQYIWKKPLQITFVRCLFVLMRYLPIALHVINIVLASTGLDNAEQVPEQYCRIMMVFRILTFSTMLALLELILITRVYALYNRSRAIGTFLVLLLVLRIASTAYSVYDHVLRLPEKIEYTSHCVATVNFKNARNLLWVIPCGILIVQVAIITLAMKRTMWDFRQYSYSLFSVLNKDGLKVFGAIVVAVVATVVTLAKKGGTLYFFIFPLLIAMISAAVHVH